MDPVNVLAKFEVRSFTHSWENSDWSFANPRPWGRGGRRRQGCYRSTERWCLVSSYRSSIVTFHLSLRVSEILPLLCSVRFFYTLFEMTSAEQQQYIEIFSVFTKYIHEDNKRKIFCYCYRPIYALQTTRSLSTVSASYSLKSLCTNYCSTGRQIVVRTCRSVCRWG